MRFPTTSTANMSLPLPSEEMVQAEGGAGYAAMGYDTRTALNVNV
jgi:hypothetical protein